MSTIINPTKQAFFEKVAKDFTSHIRQSIPLYGSYFNTLANYIGNEWTYGEVLDICGSRGDLGLYSRDSGFRGIYVNVDGSREMIKQSVEQNQNLNDYSIMAGWLAEWSEEDYFVRKWESSAMFDVIVENLAFQFMGSKMRSHHILEVKSKLRSNGVFITCEKLINPLWSVHEDLKDEFWKSRFFTKEEIEAKRENVLSDMNKDLTDRTTYVKTLEKAFKYVGCIYQAGNFYAYVCSDNEYEVIKAADYFGENVELLHNNFTICY
jgi:hypothetical protein